MTQQEFDNKLAIYKSVIVQINTSYFNELINGNIVKLTPDLQLAIALISSVCCHSVTDVTCISEADLEQILFKIQSIIGRHSCIIG
jgi:hypothetical protein